MKRFIIIILITSSLISCKKKEIRVLKKGEWVLEWKRFFYTQTGKLDFKGNGTGIYYPSASSDKVPFNYSVNGTSATFQFENPNVSNTIHKFEIVIQEKNYQVWEENDQNSSNYDKSTFIIKK